jgi:RHS repeat-associated protein
MLQKKSGLLSGMFTEKLPKLPGHRAITLEFGYDAMGNRVVKIVKPRLGGNPTNEANWIYTYYQRDAQGNVLATYERTFEDIQGTMNDRYNLKELYIYGSNRIGMIQDPNPPRDYPFTFTGIDGTTLQFTGVTYTGSPAPWGNLFANREYGRKLGNKVFEFSNHLGNVLMTASDRKLSVDQGSDGITDYYLPDVLSSQDYYAFGAIMPGRSFNSNDGRYGFMGKEKNDEIYGSAGTSYDFGARQYDPRLGRWMSVDPKATMGPWSSPYVGMANNPILMIDPDGAWPWPIWARSFIAASSVGGGLFRGDGRGPSLATDKSVTSRVWLNFTFDPQKQAILNKKLGSDLTVFYGIPGKVPPVLKRPDPKMTFTDVQSQTNSFGNKTGTFGFHYWAKDPVTPGFATPALDVHANFAVTENLETNTLFVNATFSGDEFPSTEAFIQDQSGGKLFLGAKMETGGVGDLYGDNNKPLYKVDMQIKFDDNGNFQGVYDQENDTYISPDAWNKRVQQNFGQGGDAPQQ